MRYDVGRFRRPMRRSTEGQMMSLISLGDGSTLNLDFTTGVLDSRLTFTRAANTATVINSSGLVQTVNADVPRFDHDPTTLAPRGLLIEGTATNLLSYSEDLSVNTAGNWPGRTEINTTGTPAWTGFTAPDQQSTAHKIIPNTNNQQHYLEHAATTLSSGTTYTVSLFVKPDGYNFVGIALTGSQGRATYQLVAPYTMTTYVGSEFPTITPYPNGWFRITLRWTTTITSSAFRIYVQNAQQDPVTPFIGDNSGGIQAWGAQLETGSGASSYIPTGASTATRNRDQVALTNLSSINFSQTEGTCLATVEVREKADSTFLPYGSFDTSGGGRCWWWLRHNLSTSTGTRLLGNAFNSGGSTALTTANYVYNSGNGGVVKFATSLDTAASSMVFSIAGGSPQTTTAAAFTLATAAQWGLNTSTDVTATDLGSMWVQSFKYWPTALPNAQLQSLTL